MSPGTAYRLIHDHEVMSLIAEMRAESLEEFARIPVERTDLMVRARLNLQSVDYLRTRLESIAQDYEPPQ